MHNGLAIAIIIGSLAVGAWCFVAVVRDRWIDVSHLIGLAVVEGGLLVQAALALVAMGAGAHRPGQYATFLGYLATSVLFLPAAVGLGLMERTRWGSVIAGSAAVVAAVLTVRLLQVWAT